MSDSNITSNPENEQVVSSMRTTRRDKTSSLMFALISMLGTGVVMLGALFIMKLPRGNPPEEIYVETYSGTTNPPGLERDPEPLEEQDEVEDMTEQSLDESLSSIDNFISASLAIGGKKGGRGDSRRAGPPGEGEDIIPPYERWELKFSARDLNGYGKILDNFKIELAAVGGGEPLVEYASDFSTTPKTRKAAGDQDKRLYFMYRNEGALLQFDRQLLKKSGIKTDGRTILKFITPELQAQLQKLELEYARKGRGAKVTVKEIAKTIFECQVVNNKGFQWVVIDQKYRRPSSSAAANIESSVDAELVAWTPESTFPLYLLNTVSN